jgi:hypothetical protein
VEHAAENTCFSVLSIISQSVWPDNFDTLTQIARSHGYDSQSSAFNLLSALLDSMCANTSRVDLLYVYNVHAKQLTNLQRRGRACRSHPLLRHSRTPRYIGPAQQTVDICHDTLCCLSQKTGYTAHCHW